MIRDGSRTIERGEIICPFCLLDTGRWKLIPAVWRWNRARTRLDPYEVDLKSATEFEAKVLQEHLPSCSAKTYVSPAVLALYGLQP